MYKPILCVDFDGVIHSYTSGWKGPRLIPDPPVEGAIEFLIEAQQVFSVAIYSSRSRYFLGRRAMKQWLLKHFVAMCPDYETAPQLLKDLIIEVAFAEPWEDEVKYAAKKFIAAIDFPLQKPPAFLQLDDRAITFTGQFPTNQEMKAFKPWNKK